MKFLRRTLRVVAVLLMVLLVVAAASVLPLDDTPYAQTDYYRQTRARLNALPAPRPGLSRLGATSLRAGWAVVNLTPNFKTATAGYGIRRGKFWEEVKDSVYVRAIAFDNASTRAALVSLDLLIVPPAVTALLKTRLPEVGLRWDNLFIGTTHSHNSLGGWAAETGAEFIAGPHDARVATFITDKILAALRSAQRDMQPVQMGYGDVNRADLLRNRINPDSGQLDGQVRVVKLQRSDGQTALLTTFAGHATVLDAVKDARYLSRDWPGVFVDSLQRCTKSFALFMAGAVGSMGPRVPGNPQDAHVAVSKYGAAVARSADSAQRNVALRSDSTLAVLTLPLGLRDPHLRIADGWRLRPGLFKWLLGDYPSELKALRIGNVLLLGTPCDFSGELVPPLANVARQRGLHLLVTSFNGGYIGYVTPDKYYHKVAYESRDMNWFGPQNGQYFSEMMGRMIEKMAPSPIP